jgi:uncharacterized protein with NRDE domain
VCLLVIAWQAHPRYRLVVAANRDEFHERAADPLQEWSGAPGVLAGRDLQAGGAWLAIDRSLRLGVITNYRELQRPAAGAPSRGRIIPDYLSQAAGARGFLETLEHEADRYSGFNLLLCDAAQLWYASNRASPFSRPLPPGVYGLSNHLLDTPWPKVERVRRAFRAWLDGSATLGADALMEMLADRTRAPAGEEVPQTGLSADWERVLSSPFVLHPEYGTRCSTVVLLEHDGRVLVRERRFDPTGAVIGETEIRRPRPESTDP